MKQMTSLPSHNSLPLNGTGVIQVSGNNRPSYRFLCHNLKRLGREINPNLPGDDRPDLVATLYAEAEDWLMQKHMP